MFWLTGVTMFFQALAEQTFTLERTELEENTHAVRAQLKAATASLDSAKVW